MSGPQLRVRRQPPPFQPVVVARADYPTPYLAGITLTGSGLGHLVVEQPAASVRLLFPEPGTAGLVMPVWRGNEFLLPDGRRPTIRTFTPRRVRSEAGELDLEIVLHEGGAASGWARAASPDDPAAVSGPGRGYTVDPAAPAFLLAGDETAVPAIGQLLEALPRDIRVQVLVEVAHPDARSELPAHPRATVVWYDLPPGAPPGTALVAAVTGADLDPDTRVWAAGEAAAMQRIRRHLFDERGWSRVHTTVRGYWKHGRAGGCDEG